MTSGWIEKLCAGAAALSAPLDERAAGKLALFADKLLEWGKKMDLTSITDPDEVREKHLLDSLAGAAILSGTVVDIGSGAGLPGLVLAIARPDLKVMSVESRAKRCVFQRQMIREVGIPNASVVEARAEDVVAKEPAPEWVTARAVADLAALVRLVDPWLRAGSALLAYKGPKEELLGAADLRVETRRFALPESHDPRSLVIVRRADAPPAPPAPRAAGGGSGRS